MPQVYFFYQRKTVTCQEGDTIIEIARANDIPIFTGRGEFLNCRGLGLCKSCKVRVIRTDHVSPKSFLERTKLLPNPWRLSCKTRIMDDVTVWTQGDFPTRLPMSEEDHVKQAELETQQQAGEIFTLEEITPEDVKDLIDKNEPVVLLDVREPHEVEVAQIDGAIKIPLGQIQSRLEELDPEADIILFCHHGMRSQAAAELLYDAGIKKVRNMRGGIDGWSLKVDFSVPRY